MTHPSIEHNAVHIDKGRRKFGLRRLFSVSLLGAICVTESHSAFAQWETSSLTGAMQLKTPNRTDRLTWLGTGGGKGSLKCLALLGASEGGQAN